LNDREIYRIIPVLFPAENGAETKLREEFAKTCFETLLQFSLLDGLNNDMENSCQKNPENDEGGIAGRLAVTALLHRFQEVLRRYIESERRSGKCPLPRYCVSLCPSDPILYHKIIANNGSAFILFSCQRLVE